MLFQKIVSFEERLMDLRNIYNICAFILVLLAIFVPSIFIKVLMVIFGVAMFIIGKLVQTKDEQERKKTSISVKVIKAEIEKLQLNIEGMPKSYTDKLKDNPLFWHAYKVGEEYERKGKYKEAIKSYHKILKNPLAEEESRIVAYSLIGRCHFRLFEFKDTMQNLQMALNNIKVVEDKEERLKGKALMITNIALIYRELGQWKNALKKYKSTLKLYRKLDDKLGSADSLYGIYIVYLYLNKPKKALRKAKEAIQAYQESLKVRTLKDFPMDYAKTQFNLGSAYHTLAEVKDKAENCEKAIQAYQESLKVRTLKDFPMDYAMTQNNLGIAYDTLAEVKDKAENCEKAIQAYQESLKVRTRKDLPMDYAIIQNNLATVFGVNPSG